MLNLTYSEITYKPVIITSHTFCANPRHVWYESTWCNVHVIAASSDITIIFTNWTHKCNKLPMLDRHTELNWTNHKNRARTQVDFFVVCLEPWGGCRRGISWFCWKCRPWTFWRWWWCRLRIWWWSWGFRRYFWKRRWRFPSLRCRFCR